MSTTGGKAVIDALAAQGVELVFGIPGTHNLELYRHLAGSGIRHVTPRHEQGGGYAADAYARVTGRPGVVITTSGPGLTNAVTAAATAYADSVPMLLVSPGVPRGMERADVGWLHEMKDQQAHLDAVVDRSIRVSTPDEAAAAIAETFARWRVQRPRPVHLEVPVDVLEEHVDNAAVTGGCTAPQDPTVPGDDDIAAAGSVLTNAGSVVMVVGGGARLATEQVRQVAERLRAPVVTTVNGKGVLPEDHPLSAGASIRFDAAHEAISAADALLVVGSVLGNDELWGHTVTTAAPVVRVDVDKYQLHKNLAATNPLHGDATATLAALIQHLPSAPAHSGNMAPDLRDACDQEAAHLGTPFAAYHQVLRDLLPAEAIIAGDSTQVSYSGTAHQWISRRPGQFVYPAGFATLGYGIPGGIGAALAAPGTPVVVIAGDGGTMFNINEFATAVDLGLALPVVVFNNGGFAEIREEMDERGIERLGVAVRSPDFPLLGRAFGGEGERVTDTESFRSALTRAMARDCPTLIEISCS